MSTFRATHDAALTTIDVGQLSWHAALERLGGDSGLLAFLLRDFDGRFREEAVRIRELLAHGDLAGTVERLHALKGVAATLGADALAQLAANLESLLRTDDDASRRELDPELVAFADVLHGSLAAMAEVAERLETQPVPPASGRSPAPGPVRRRHDTSRPNPRTACPAFSRSGLPAAQRLLVVDDQPAFRLALAQLFRDRYDVTVASGGREALEICRRRAPDLVLLDIVMPGMDGLETYLRLKSESDSSDVPIIFITSENRPGQEARALEYGAVDFISKPLHPDIVRARVDTHMTLKAQADMLRSLAFVDGLTGIGNRRLFDDRLDLEWRSCRRSGTDLSLLMIDVDHFKRYNDHLGHQQGDLCLREVASVLAGELYRPRDFLARYGGEEFACLLPETGHAGAHAKAGRLVAAVEARRIPHPDSDCGDVVTVCIGLATARPSPDGSAGDLLARADAQLYHAKEAGRNRVSAEGHAPAPWRALAAGRHLVVARRRPADLR